MLAMMISPTRAAMALKAHSMYFITSNSPVTSFTDADCASLPVLISRFLPSSPA